MCPPAGHEAAAHQLLVQFTRLVRHHVERHVHLRLRDGVFHRLRDEQLQGAERQRVEASPHATRLAALREHFLHLAGDLRALLGVGGVTLKKRASRRGPGSRR